ncbi:hypothetical protein UlMin_025400 [Ulmus minor]
MNPFLALFFFFLTNPLPVFPSSFPDRFTKSLSPSLLPHKSKDYFELAHPLPSDRLTPSSTFPILRHSFANTINAPPFTTSYSPPSDCLPPWSFVVLEFRAKCKGEQYDRISGLWLAGVELLRTSTAEPNQCGIFWKVRKDVTRYSSLFSRSNLDLTMMLENVVNKEYTGVYHVEVNLLFYKENLTNRNFDRKLGFVGDNLGLKSDELDPNLGVEVEKPADLIIPISDSGDRGFWFRIESELDLGTRKIRIPKNTRRAVLELYVSFHGNDEFWYSNPPNSYVAMNNLDTRRANGAYREVFVTIDGELVGSEVPFPVVFTGGINPLFWEPVVAIGAFNLPSYDLELTPFLEKLLDKKLHTIGIGVSEGISYWLVNANLHLWLDHNSRSVEAKSSFSQKPSLEIEKGFQFSKLDGSFKIKAERATEYIGWVKWSGGNHTTTFSQTCKFKNKIRFQNNGSYKSTKQKIKAKKELRVTNEKHVTIRRTSLKRRYPLNVITATFPGSRRDTYILVTNVSHSMKDKYVDRDHQRRVHNTQDSGGWMEVKDHSVISGYANTRQTFGYSDGFGCYLRTVDASNGRLVRDITTFDCLSLSPS